MATLELVNGKFELDVSSREKPLIDQVPSALYKRATGKWTMPASWASAKLLRGVFRDYLTVGESVAEWSWTERARVEAAMEARELALDPERDLPGDSRLYPFQRTGVQFLRTAGSAILGDDLGTGKTVQSLVAVEHWPLLVITTKSVKGQWGLEVPKWATGLSSAPVSAIVLEGGAVARRKHFEEAQYMAEQGIPFAMIVNWEQLAGHSKLARYGSEALVRCEACGGASKGCEVHPKELNLIEWGTVIADEAHKAKAPKAKQTRALWAIGDKARSRFALTGTPLEGSLLDFWALLRFVAPDEWPSRSAYIDRYCVKEYNFFGGMEVGRLRADTELEFREIVEPRMLRRPKELVAPWLPAKVYETRTVGLSTASAKVYKALAEEFVAELEGGGELIAFSDLSRQARLVQLTGAMLEEIDDGGGGPQCEDCVTGEHEASAHISYRMIEPSPKLDELETLLSELNGAPCAVFSSSRQLLALAQARLEKKEIPYGIIAGDLPQEARDLAKDQYNAGDVNILLVSLGAGAEGLNLTRGSTEVFIDRDWSFLKNKQAEDRMHGIGRGDQDAEHITIVDIVCENTLDEGRIKLYQTKGELMEHLVRDKEAIKRMLKGEL